MVLRALFILLISLNATAQDVFIPRALNLSQKSFEFSLEGSSYASSTRVDTDGEKQDFAEGENFSQTEVQLNAAFGWTKEIQIKAGIRSRSNASVIFDGVRTRSLTNSGIDSFYVQSNYMFKRSGKLISNIEFRYRQATYTNPEFDNLRPYAHLVLGDADQEISLGYRFYYLFNKVKNGSGIDGSVFYNASADLAKEVLFDFKLVNSGVDWAFYGGIKGSMPVGKDEFTDNPSAKPEQYTGSTFLYNSLNRSKISLNLGAVYKFNKSWRASLGYIHDLSGKSTDIGGRMLLGLSYRKDSYYREKREKNKFKNYSVEAIVEKSSSQGNYVVISKGFTHGLQKRARFDFFAFDFKGGNRLLARGVVVKTKSKESIVKITKWFSGKQSLDEGVIARGSLD